MYELLTDELRVEVLDPVADQALTGPRYCTGGYVFQVHDARLGPLMTGPTYPDSFNWFDGQGIPDSFALAPVPVADDPNRALLLGVGVCDLEAPAVVEPCAWTVEQAAAALTFRTTHAWAGLDIALVRTVSLDGRTLRSVTELVTTVHDEAAVHDEPAVHDERVIAGHVPASLPVRWFPHPFFPQPSSEALFRTSFPVAVPENEGYLVDDEGAVRRRVLAPGHLGHYQLVDHTADAPLTLVHRHDALGSITMTTSYVPGQFVVWGNHYTVSAEPFLELTLPPDTPTTWTVTYTF
ncbi:hypothetical protein [Cellulomonas persica]|uniref:Aldose 1-epimerase n=1 Tax=Cellulomonas persica TaxID=76861 RepID=A0A510V0N4_9CELL|nr:hypothetical protein [Cellulomonas persica]GEK18900.1 hypothetical protein CPE01_26330 [Cellulomonas persica]